MAAGFLKSLYAKINGNVVHGVNNAVMPTQEQRAFLASFAEPRDDFERSFFKYKCFCEYCYYTRKWMIPIYNLGAMVIYPFIYARFVKKGRARTAPVKKVDSVIENVPRLRNDDVIPQELKDIAGKTVELESLDYKNGCLTEHGIQICRELRKRYFWHFYFRTIVTMKLALFNGYLADYAPKRIVFYSCEREFSGPLQTRLCEQHNAQYMAFMHGDYLYNLSFAFQKYSRYYTWDEAYNKMFESLRCEFPTTIYRPRKLSGIARSIPEQECDYFATYYFSAETRECAERIAAVFRELESHHLRCKIRAHPRFSDMAMLAEVFEGIAIEDTANHSLADSITESLYTIGLNTTVLSEAYFSDKKVAIDDVSDPEQYESLKDRGFIMLSRPHALLSEIAAQIKTDNPYDESYRFFIA